MSNIIDSNYMTAADNALKAKLSPYSNVKIIRILTEIPQDWEALLTYLVDGVSHNFKPGDEVRVPDDNEDFSFYKLDAIISNKAKWRKKGSGDSALAKVIVNLETYVSSDGTNYNKTSDDVSGISVELIKDGEISGETKVCASGETSVTFTGVEPLVDYTVKVSSLSNYDLPTDLTITNLDLGDIEELTFKYYSDLYNLTTSSNLNNDNTISAIEATVTYGGLNYQKIGTFKVAKDTSVSIVFPDVSGYKKTITVSNFSYSALYQTEIVTVNTNTDQEGVAAEGQTITINNVDYIVPSTGIVQAKIPFDTTYSVSANAWIGLDEYTTPETLTGIVASNSTRLITMTYTKILGTTYSLVVNDNQYGASNAATDANITVKYTKDNIETTLGTTFKNGDTFLIPNGATNITVTGSSITNYTPDIILSGLTYTVTYKALKVTVSISGGGSGLTVALKDTTKNTTVLSGISSFIGYVAWGDSWSVEAAVTTSKYPVISPSSGTANSTSTSASVTYTSYTLITSGAADLGLPSGKLWAAVNVGASNYYDDGLYFSWGDTTGHAANSGYSFSSSNYDSGASGSGHNLTADFVSGDATYDGARANMGGTWRTPTQDELKELIDNCIWIWISLGGANGYLVINNNRGIFIPAVGSYNSTTLNNVGSYGRYRSNKYSGGLACFLNFSNSNKSVNGYNSRYYGLTIRAIKDPEAVDLGNGVKWATGNLTKDAQGNYSIAAPTEYGAYFSWGNTNGQRVAGQTDSYSFDSTTYNSTTGHNLTADFTSGSTTYDAARVRLGSPWRIPTYDELNWLKNNCTWNWKASGNTDYNGVAGYEVVGTNSNKIFMPATGYYNGNSLDSAGTSGNYWSPKNNTVYGPYDIYFNNSTRYWANSPRYYGLSIRPVK